jgi:hypothetical protein
MGAVRSIVAHDSKNHKRPIAVELGDHSAVIGDDRLAGCAHTLKQVGVGFLVHTAGNPSGVAEVAEQDGHDPAAAAGFHRQRGATWIIEKHCDQGEMPQTTMLLKASCYQGR